MDFSDDFLSYPNFKNEVKYSILNISNYNQYFRHIIIYCKKMNYYLQFKNINIENKKNI